MGQCQTQCSQLLKKEQSEEVNHKSSKRRQTEPKVTQSNSNLPISKPKTTFLSEDAQDLLSQTQDEKAPSNPIQSSQQNSSNPFANTQNTTSLTQIKQSTHIQIENSTQKLPKQPQDTNQEKENVVKEPLKYKVASTVKNTPPKQEIVKVKFRACICIFYGTSEGIAADKAFELAEKFQREEFYVKLVHLQNFEPWMLRACQVAIFILESQGPQKGPTDDAQQFYLWLNNFDNSSFPLKQLKFAVFGLYNSITHKKMSILTNIEHTEADSTIQESSASLVSNTHQNYQNEPIEDNNPSTSRFNIALTKKPAKIKSMGQRIDMVLEEIGASRLHSLKQIDSFKCELLNDTFKNYSKLLVEYLVQKYPSLEIPQEDAENAALPFNISFQVNHDEETNENATSAEWRRKQFDNQHSTAGSISKQKYPLREEMWEYFSAWNTSITKTEIFTLNNDNNSQIAQQGEYMVVELGNDKGEAFETGGIIEVFPINDTQSVEQLMKALNIDSKTELKIQDQSINLPLEFRPPIPSPLPVYQYIREFMDMQRKVDQNQVYELSQYCQKKEDKEELKQLCKFQNKERFDKEIGQVYSLLSLIIKYNILIPVSLLCGLSKLIKPRCYILSSSYPSSPKSLSFIVKLQQRPKGSNYKCLASEYFREVHKSLQNKSSIQMRIKCTSNPQWKLPLSSKEEKLKIIFICIEEGISFCHAFLKHIRAAKLKQQLHLYYGCRLLNNQSYLLKEELFELYEQNILSSIDVALTDSNGQTKLLHCDQNQNNKQTSSSSQNNNINSNQHISSNKKIDLMNSLNKDDTKNLNQDMNSVKSNWSPIQLLIENQIDQFSTLVTNIREKDSNVRIYICGSQLLSQGILGAIAKAYSLLANVSQYKAFNAVLDLETEGKIVRVTWTNPITN